MIVTFIDDNGFLRVAGCGGVDRATLPLSLIHILASTSTAPHTAQTAAR